MTAHFVSKTCEGEKCRVCNAPATHKLGEMIPHDEPCIRCGTTWHYYEDTNDVGQRVVGVPKNNCYSRYHLSPPVGGPQHQRHNLTAYVCCVHFETIVGVGSCVEKTLDE